MHEKKLGWSASVRSALLSVQREFICCWPAEAIHPCGARCVRCALWCIVSRGIAWCCRTIPNRKFARTDEVRGRSRDRSWNRSRGLVGAKDGVARRHIPGGSRTDGIVLVGRGRRRRRGNAHRRDRLWKTERRLPDCIAAAQSIGCATRIPARRWWHTPRKERVRSLG